MEGEKQNYAGLTLGEKKTLTSHEEKGAAAIKKLQAKLGTGWTIRADWPSIIKAVKEHRSGDFPYIHLVYERLFQNIADEAEKFDAQIVEVLNTKVGANKVYHVAFGESPKSNDYKNGGGRCQISVDGNGVHILWNPESSVCSNPMYPYSDSYGLKSYFLNQEGSDGLSLAVSNLVKEHAKKGDAAIEKLKKKLGADWTINCDFGSAISAMKQHRSGDVPYIHLIYERLYQNIADDAEKMDADEVEALNDKVGDKKVVRVIWAQSPKDVPSSSNGGGRCIISFNEGLHILWNPESSVCSNPMFPYSDKYNIKKFVLDNC